MNKLNRILAIGLLSLSIPTASYAGHGEEKEEEAPVSKISYYDLSPEIVTNYAAPGKKIGFIRIKVQLMTEDPADISVLEYHSPMIRDIIISTLNKRPNSDFNAKGFEDIKRDCRNQIEAFIQKEEGRKIIRDILFTNTIWE
jgi:flagellar FliL protein